MGAPSNTTGTNNTAIGEMALDFNQRGSNNTALGFEAGVILRIARLIQQPFQALARLLPMVAGWGST